MKRKLCISVFKFTSRIEEFP